MKMKLRNSLKLFQTKAGYTLMELLVGVTLLGALSGLAIGGLRGALQKAHRLESRVDLINIVTAIEGYYNEHGVYPDLEGEETFYNAQADGDASFATNGSEGGNQDLVKLLVEGEEARYLSGRQASGKNRSGLDATQYSYLDHWGHPYEVYWDANYDGQLTNPLNPNEVLNRGVVAIGRGSATSFSNIGKEGVKSW